MATYYVRKTGSDAAAGTSAGAAWLTIGKALGAAGIASGDTVYVGPGTYRECVTVGMTSATAETKVIGDVDGSETGDAPGPVIWTAYTTNDKTAPAADRTLTLNNKDYLTFQDLVFVGGNIAAQCVYQNSSGNNNTFRRCLFLASMVASNLVQFDIGADLNASHTLDSCIFAPLGGSAALQFTLVTSASADYDVNCLVTNCVFFGQSSGNNITVTSSGASSFKGGGVDVMNSTLMDAGRGFWCASANLSTSIPCTIYNSVINGGVTACLHATTSGQIVEDYNLVIGSTARTNVSAGSNSQSGSVSPYAPLRSFGQEWLWGFRPRPPLEPMAGSPLLGFGAQAGGPSVDILGRTRPAGGASASKALGAFERGNTFGKETGTVRTGSNAISVTGPGYQEFDVPVDATSTTISCYVRWDATYAGTKPQLQIDANGEIGVTTETKTATGSSGSWEQLTLTAFTPTAAGIVKIRVVSSDTNGGGKMFVDDFAVV